ncbi:hypothetical protein BH24ACT23_BH24ACT23_00520 [soil metagenome]
MLGVGAVGGLVGDACHVEAGTTVYLDESLPFIWNSQLWFPVAVGLATVATGELRLRLGPARAETAAPLGESAAAIAAVLGIYALTAILTGENPLAATVLVWALAILVAVRFGGGGPALACAALAAVLGPLAEIGVVELDLASYSPEADGLAGVAEWLPALYFAFGIVAARLAEITTSRRRRSEA